MSAMSEQEEFEFRHRMESEQGQQAPTPAAPSWGDVAEQAGQSALSAVKNTFNPAPAALATAQNPEQTYKTAGPWLPAAGGAIGSAFGPAGTVVGAGAGELTRQGLGVMFNDPRVMDHITPGRPSLWAGGQAALQTGLAGVGELPLVQRGIAAAANKLAPLGERALNAGAQFGQMLSGKPAAKIKMLFRDPTATLPESLGGAKSISAAGQGMEDALKQTGIQKKTFNPFEGNDHEAATIGKQTFDKWQAIKNGGAAPAELPVVDLAVAKESEAPVALFVGNDTMGDAPRALYTIYQKGQPLGAARTLPAEQLPEGVTIIGREARAAGQVPAGTTAAPEITAQEAYNAKRATDYVFPKVVSERNKEKIAQLTEFKHAMDDILATQAGPLQAASKDYARSRLGADFTQILPRTKTGDISTVKTLGMALLDAKRAALLPFTSPLTVGAVTSAASLGSRLAGKIATSPTARQALISRLIEGTSSGTGGTNDF